MTDLLRRCWTLVNCPRCIWVFWELTLLPSSGGLSMHWPFLFSIQVLAVRIEPGSLWKENNPDNLIISDSSSNLIDATDNKIFFFKKKSTFSFLVHDPCVVFIIVFACTDRIGRLSTLTRGRPLTQNIDLQCSKFLMKWHTNHTVGIIKKLTICN